MTMSATELLLFRRNRRMTQADMADALGVSRMTVNNWERERFAIPKDIVARLAAMETPERAQTSAQHRKDVEAQLAWYRGWRAITDHAGTMKNMPAGRTLDPETIAILAAEFPDFT